MSRYPDIGSHAAPSGYPAFRVAYAWTQPRRQRRCHPRGVRVAIVAESFLPNVNGVTNSVLRVIEHLRRTGHEALVIAPDTPRGEPPADRVHDGIRVHRVPSRMFPKVTSLPLGVPRPRMVGVLRGFDPHVVHLASPALLGYGGLHAARYLGVPTVAVFQTDVAGFAESYGIGVAVAGGVGVDPAPAQARRPHPGAVHRGDGKPCRPSYSAGAPLGSRGRHHRLRAVGPRRASCAGGGRRTASRSSGSSAGSRRRSMSNGWRRWPAATTCSWSSSATASTGPSSQALLPSAVFTGALYGDAAGRRVRQHGRLRAPRRARDVLPGRAGGDGVRAAGHRTRRRRPARPGRALCAPACCCRSANSRRGCRSPSTICSPNGRATRLAARRSVLGRTWPAICDELLGHYEAVQAEGRRRRRAARRVSAARL